MQSNKAANLDIQAGQTNVEWMLLEGQCLGSIQMQFKLRSKNTELKKFVENSFFALV